MRPGAGGIYRYADVLRHDTNATGNLTSALSWPIPYGFTNLAVVVTVSALYPPLTYKADVCIDAAEVGVRAIGFVVPPTLYDTTNSTWTTTISCSPTNIGGIRNFTLYFMNSDWSAAPTNKFYLKQVRLIGY